MTDTDDDVIAFPAEAVALQYPWFQQPAPPAAFTFCLAAISFVLTLWFYLDRVATMREKFGSDFKGSLRACALISAYMDTYGVPRFSTLRLCTKSFLFLGLLQLNFHRGFWIMWTVLVLESSLDTIRVLLAYHNCGSLDKAQPLTDEETPHLQEANSTTLVPTNVYEDLTRPKSIAVMVFMVQFLLIGLVMDDTYVTTTRTCFNGSIGCAMLTSWGSYALYLMGTFMASVFYIGPNNSYGQKEQNPTFWLKVFLMSKEGKSSLLIWTDSVTEQEHSYELEPNDWRVWLRFILSFLINGVGFHFLLHILPIQIAGQSTIIGVVFRAIGMIYLADLDDATGSTMTMVQVESDGSMVGANSDGKSKYGSTLDSNGLDEAKQRIIDQAMEDVQAQLEALVGNHNVAPVTIRRRRSKIVSIPNALMMAVTRNRKKKTDHETPLVDKTFVD